MKMNKSSIISIAVVFMLVSTLSVGALAMFGAPTNYETSLTNQRPSTDAFPCCIDHFTEFSDTTGMRRGTPDMGCCPFGIGCDTPGMGYCPLGIGHGTPGMGRNTPGMGRGGQGMGRGGQGTGRGTPDAPCHFPENRQTTRQECRALLS